MSVRYRRLGQPYTMVVQSGSGGNITDVWWVGANTLKTDPHWRPSTDVYETAGAFVVTVEIAGVPEDAVEVLLYPNALVVEGRRTLAGVGEAERYYVFGIRQGPFRLEVSLPASVDQEAVDARYERGLLVIRLPKVQGGRAHDRRA